MINYELSLYNLNQQQCSIKVNNYNYLTIFGQKINISIFKKKWVMKMSKKLGTKNDLLEWVNSSLKSEGVAISKIEQLGTGVAYLLLLNNIHPGILAGVRYSKKPSNQYEYQLNLKLFSIALNKLGIHKVIDIQKLSKMKMQDHLFLLQWLYNYSESRNIHISDIEPSKQYKMNRKQKGKLGQKLKLVQPDSTTTKTDIESNGEVELKIVTSASKRINLIKEIIHNENIQKDQIKIMKICQVLNLKKEYKNGEVMTPKNKEKIEEGQKEEQEVNRMEEIYCHTEQTNTQNNEKQRKEITYVRCRKLQQRYEQYIKSSMFKLKDEVVSEQNGEKEKFRFQPEMPSIAECGTVDRNSRRLTENSILLQSDRRSLCTEYLLNDQ